MAEMADEALAVEQCSEMCDEARTDSCSALGVPCMILTWQGPRRPPRQITYSPQFILSAREITGDPDWWPRRCDAD